jgi:uncharacterized membrane protein YfcA
VVVKKTKLAVALSILGLVVGTCIGYGIIRISQSQGKFVFDLMFLLTMIYTLIRTIRERQANEKDQWRE